MYAAHPSPSSAPAASTSSHPSPGPRQSAATTRATRLAAGTSVARSAQTPIRVVAASSPSGRPAAPSAASLARARGANDTARAESRASAACRPSVAAGGGGGARAGVQGAGERAGGGGGGGGDADGEETCRREEGGGRAEGRRGETGAVARTGRHGEALGRRAESARGGIGVRSGLGGSEGKGRHAWGWCGRRWCLFGAESVEGWNRFNCKFPSH
jgi:hypothetical protein